MSRVAKMEVAQAAEAVPPGQVTVFPNSNRLAARPAVCGADARYPKCGQRLASDSQPS